MPASVSEACPRLLWKASVAPLISAFYVADRSSRYRYGGSGGRRPSSDNRVLVVLSSTLLMF